MNMNHEKIFCYFFVLVAIKLIAGETKSIQISHDRASFKLAPNASSFQITASGLMPENRSGSSTFVSPVISCPFAFNAAGAHWLAETPGESSCTVSLRFSIDGKNWGRWLRIPADEEPVAELAEDGRPNPFAGDIVGALAFVDPDSRFLQYRLDFSGSGNNAPVVKRMSLQIIYSADGPEIDDILQAKADRGERVHKNTGKVPKPVLVTRAEWGAQAPRYAYTYTTVGHIAFHHTAGVSDYNVADKDDCAARVRAIQSYHRNTLGWNDIGYAYAICKLGHIFQGREDDDDNTDVQGAHDAFNAGSMGVANMGYFHPPYNHRPTLQMLNALYRLLAWKCDERGIDPQGRSLYVAFGDVVDQIYGHREVRPTACPGDSLFLYKQAIKDSVAQIIAGITTHVAFDNGLTPEDFRLLQAYPNPFFARSGQVASVSLQLTESLPVRIVLYNAIGQVVRVLHEGVVRAGKTVLQWDGRDARGRVTPPGVYFYHLSTPVKSEHIKFVVFD